MYVCHGTRAHLSGVLHKYLQLVCVCVSTFVAMQRLGKHVATAANTRSNRRIVERLSVGLCTPLPFPHQRRIIGGVFLYAIRVLSKGIRQFFRELLVHVNVAVTAPHRFGNWHGFVTGSSRNPALGRGRLKHRNSDTTVLSIEVGNGTGSRSAVVLKELGRWTVSNISLEKFVLHHRRDVSHNLDLSVCREEVA
jgi:hypothetical protein